MDEENISTENYIPKLKEEIIKELREKWNATDLEIEIVLRRLKIAATTSVVTIGEAGTGTVAT